MKNRVKALLVSFVCLVCLAQGNLFATIQEITSIVEVDEHITPETLVVFDLDNTIFEPVQELGNDQWFRRIIKDYRDIGLDHEVAVEKALVDWLSVQGATKMKLVEDESAELIKSLQKRGITVMGLTTRGMEISVQTLHHLRELGAELAHTAPLEREEVFMNGPRGVLFKNGVLFTSGTHKGHALLQILEKANYKPKRVLFINDKKSNIQEVAEICYNKEISFVGLRYGYLDGKVSSYDHDVATLQFQHFGNILTDEHAKGVLNK